MFVCFLLDSNREVVPADDGQVEDDGDQEVLPPPHPIVIKRPDLSLDHFSFSPFMFFHDDSELEILGELSRCHLGSGGGVISQNLEHGHTL